MSLSASREPLLAGESGQFKGEHPAHNLSVRRGGSDSLARIEASANKS